MSFILSTIFYCSLYELSIIISSNLCEYDVIKKNRSFGLKCFDLLLFQCPIQLIEPGVVTSTSIIVKTHYSFIITIKIGSQELCRFVAKCAPLLLDFIRFQHKQLWLELNYYTK